MLISALGCFLISLHLVLYGHLALGGGLPYVHQMKPYKSLYPAKKTSVVLPPVQLKFGKYLAQFVNGTLRMGTESLEPVGKSNLQIHGRSFRIAGNKLMIGNDTVVPRDGKEVMLEDGLIMQPDGTIVPSGPDQRGNEQNCRTESSIGGCGIWYNLYDCCRGYRCWDDRCRRCPLKDEYELLVCKSDDNCQACYGGSGFCSIRSTLYDQIKHCCIPAGYVCKSNEQCCENSYCETIPNDSNRCRFKADYCQERKHCEHNTECCSIHECKTGRCQCKLGTTKYCYDNKECCRAERCDNGICVCLEEAECQEETDCCQYQICVNNKCKSCKLQSDACKVNSDCCSVLHCYRGHCRHSFVWYTWVKYADTDEHYKIPYQCLPEDVNADHGGKYSYVCPVYTHKAAEGATGFKLLIGKCNRPDLLDLAKGDNTDNPKNYWGSVCRYLEVEWEKNSPSKVYQIEWTINFQPKPEDQSHYVTAGDVNLGRGGRDLFFNWHLYHVDPNSDFKPSMIEDAPCEQDVDCGDQGHCYDNNCRQNYIKAIYVHYEDEYNPYKIPPYCFHEDVNSGLGGKYIYICPNFTSSASEAATSFTLEIDSSCNRARNLDLTKGTGETCRYLVSTVESEYEHKIVQIEITKKPIFETTSNGTAGNINRERVGSQELYFNWYTVSIRSGSEGQNAECGLQHGKSKCTGQYSGACCSIHGWCGHTDDYCGYGCQPLYGNCTDQTQVARCGHEVEISCAGDECCSTYGYCGTTVDYCGEGCQYDWGHCD